MFTSKQYREKADEYSELMKTANGPNEIKEFGSLKRGFSVLADDKQWLADRAGKAATIQTNLEKEEARILQCLGAALIMEWSTLPRKLQRALFDKAGAIVELSEAAPLRARFASFIRKHKLSKVRQDRRGPSANNLNPNASELTRWDNEGGASRLIGPLA